MGKTLYLDCENGITAEAVVGALLALGANEAGLRRALDSLKVNAFEVHVTDAGDEDVAGRSFEVTVAEMASSASEKSGYKDASERDVEQQESSVQPRPARIYVRDFRKNFKKLRGLGKKGRKKHAAPHSRSTAYEGVVAQPSWENITQLVNAADLAPRAKSYARCIIENLEQAGIEPIDSQDVVKLVSAAYCLDEFDVSDGIVSPPPQDAATPLGSAIAEAVRTQDGLPENHRVVARGVGRSGGISLRASVVEEPLS